MLLFILLTEYFRAHYLCTITGNRNFFEFVWVTRQLFHLIENGSKDYVINISCNVAQTVQLDYS